MFITAVRVERDLGVPSVSFNTLTGHRSCAPEDCGERSAYLAAGAGAGLQASFRRAFTCAFWRLGFRQSGFRHITRIFPACRPVRLGPAAGFLGRGRLPGEVPALAGPFPGQPPPEPAVRVSPQRALR